MDGKTANYYETTWVWDLIAKFTSQYPQRVKVKEPLIIDETTTRFLKSCINVAKY